MLRTVLLLTVSLLGGVVPLHAAQLAAVWDYPTDAPPGVTFVLTMTSASGESPQQTPTTGTPCPTAVQPTATTRCSVFACPAPGIYTLWVQASQGGQLSATSNVLTCQIAGTTPCDCTTLDDTTPSSDPNPAHAQVSPAVPLSDPAITPATPGPPGTPAPVAQLSTITAVDTNLVLSWEYPRDASAPTPTRFLLSYTTPGSVSPTLYAVPLHEVTACATVSGADAHTWCTRLACPGPGAFTFTVQADSGGTLAPASNAQACTIVATQAPCPCDGTTPPAIPLAPPLAVALAPDPPQATLPPTSATTPPVGSVDTTTPSPAAAPPPAAPIPPEAQAPLVQPVAPQRPDTQAGRRRPHHHPRRNRVPQRVRHRHAATVG